MLENLAKKRKLEECPHGLACYRRNPHHFNEYRHAHLVEYISKSGEFDFPANFTQTKAVYLEQLDVIRKLMRIKLDTKPAKTVTIPGDMPTIEPTTSSTIKTAPIFNTSQKTKLKAGNLIRTESPGTSKQQKPKPGTITQGKTMQEESSSNGVRMPGKRLNMMERMEATKPYNLFFTIVPEALQTRNPDNCISFPDLLCPSLGRLTNSLQINFMIDIMWLMEQYQVHKLCTVPLTILYGYEWPDMEKYIDLKLKNVKYKMVKLKDPFGTHHSKMGIYEYDDGSIRVVISTANLYFEDWNYYNQGLWMSPALPKMPDSSPDYSCSGPTGFKTGLLKYLNSYELPQLNEWITRVKRADFSQVRVHFISSIPGKHYPKDVGCHLHQVGDVLSKLCSLPEKTGPQSEGPLSWGVIAQSSSIGSLGKTAGDWLRKVLLRSLASHKRSPLPNNSSATLSFVYPTGKNVMYSHFGAQGGGCLPYAKTVNDKQLWFKEYLHQWKADVTGRSRAMPHIKSYCRVSPCLTKLAYFLLTSANLSKSAWGGNVQKDSGCYVRSYEAGVLFMPSAFDEEHFKIRSEGDEKSFPFMLDLPLEPYESQDEPWCN